MITKKEIKPFTSTDMGASFESDPISVVDFLGFSLTLNLTGAPVGTIKIQVSNDTSDIAASVTLWDDLESSSAAVSAAGTVTYNVSDVWYNKIKVVYTRTSGTGAMSAKLTGKG